MYALLVFILIREYLYQKERRSLMEMIMAKDLPEFKEAEVKKEVKVTPPELVPEDLASDRDFDKAIKKDLGREGLVEKLKSKLTRGR